VDPALFLEQQWHAAHVWMRVPEQRVRQLCVPGSQELPLCEGAAVLPPSERHPLSQCPWGSLCGRAGSLCRGMCGELQCRLGHPPEHGEEGSRKIQEQGATILSHHGRCFLLWPTCSLALLDRAGRTIVRPYCQALLICFPKKYRLWQWNASGLKSPCVLSSGHAGQIEEFSCS